MDGFQRGQRSRHAGGLRQVRRSSLIRERSETPDDRLRSRDQLIRCGFTDLLPILRFHFVCKSIQLVASRFEIAFLETLGSVLQLALETLPDFRVHIAGIDILLHALL